MTTAHFKEKTVAAKTSACSSRQATALFESAARMNPSKETIGEILRQLHEAADAGNTRAMNHLGLLYVRGTAVEQDIPQATALFERATAAGLAESRYSLGLIYWHGLGVKRDTSLALSHFGIAAQCGHQPSASRWCWLMSLEGLLWRRKSALTG